MDSYCSENITELAKALLKVQTQMAPATKDAVNPFIRNRYATLNSVMDTCRSALIANGIWLTQLPMPAPDTYPQGHIALLTKLTHAESGQWQASLTVVPLPKADPQGMGSAITYARRYALTSMLGMITEDDDGEAAKLPPKRIRSAVAPQDYDHDEEQAYRTPELEPMDQTEILPSLDGVTYKYATTQEGRQYIIATGNTHPKKEILRGAGFSWNPQRKIWWKFTDAA